MKRLLNRLKCLAILALLTLVAGCASNPVNEEQLAINAAGFKVITPVNPDQQAILAKLPKDKVSPVT